MDVFSADLAAHAFQKCRRRWLDQCWMLNDSENRQRARQADRPVLYAGGGVLSAGATQELAALAEALELPVAHTLMGKGCLHEAIRCCSARPDSGACRLRTTPAARRI
jgi:acetolactate synthase-1/2/3 large subunit